MPHSLIVLLMIVGFVGFIWLIVRHAERRIADISRQALRDDTESED